MNRRVTLECRERSRVPRASGDEPQFRLLRAHLESVFPARAGMNRVNQSSIRPSLRVPRASGDEPADDDWLMFDRECSPRERG